MAYDSSTSAPEGVAMQEAVAEEGTITGRRPAVMRRLRLVLLGSHHVTTT